MSDRRSREPAGEHTAQRGGGRIPAGQNPPPSVSNGQDAAEQQIAARIAAFVQSWGGDFNSLALELFAYQYEFNAPFRRFCSARGQTPATVGTWEEIPAAPADAFRTQELRCSPEPPAALFQTSGTTGGLTGELGRGRHYLSPRALGLYDLSLRTGFQSLASRAAGLPLRALAAPYDQSPDSSLSYMLSALAGQVPHSEFFWREGGPDLPAAIQALRSDISPVLLFTTAFALLELLDSLDSPLPLPPGSVVIETGGFKGRRRAVEREELYALACEKLVLLPGAIGSEYGMCEMASQFYDSRLSETPTGEPVAASPDPVKVGPPWLRTQFIDPATGEVAAPGQEGLLRHFDLCNLNSVMAIQTMDLGVPAAGGFILKGRLPAAPPRGCSLTIEEWRETKSRAN